MNLPLHNDCIHDAIRFVKQRQNEKQNNKWRQVGKLFTQFTNLIQEFSNKGGDSKIADELNKLKLILREELNADICYKPGEMLEPDEEPEFKGPDLNKTYYPIVLKHFIQLTKQFISHPNDITKDEIEKSEKELDVKLKSHPVSEKLRSFLSGLFTALAGLTIGAVIGGLTTGGVGAIPGAIIGTIVGFTSGGLFGFFHARRQNNITEARKKKFEIIDNSGKRLAEPEIHAQNTLAQIKNLVS